MAAFAAGPMPYRNFSALRAAPVDAKQSVNGLVGIEQSIEVGQSVAFPLLIAALPEVIQFPLPDAAAPATDQPDKPTALLPEAKNTELATEATTPERPGTQPRATFPSSEQTKIGPTLTAPAARFPHRDAPAKRTQKEHTPASSGTHVGTTPLAEMFRELQTASRSPTERTQSQSRLRNVFNCL
jgi:hypothetical protein